MFKSTKRNFISTSTKAQTIEDIEVKIDAYKEDEEVNNESLKRPFEQIKEVLEKIKEVNKR